MLMHFPQPEYLHILHLCLPFRAFPLEYSCLCDTCVQVGDWYVIRSQHRDPGASSVQYALQIRSVLKKSCSDLPRLIHSQEQLAWHLRTFLRLIWPKILTADHNHIHSRFNHRVWNSEGSEWEVGISAKAHVFHWCGIGAMCTFYKRKTRIQMQ